MLGSPTFISNMGNNPSSGGNSPRMAERLNTPTPTQSAQISGLQTSLQMTQGAYQPSLELLNQQAGQLQGQFGMSQAAFGMASDAQRRAAEAEMGRLTLGPEYDAIQRAANLRQMAGLDTLDGLARLSLANQVNGIRLGEKSAWEKAGQANYGIRSDATARGAMSGPGVKHQYKNVRMDLANQLEGFKQQQIGVELGAEEQRLSRAEQRNQLADRNRMLDIKAKEYGLDKAKIEAGLAEGLAKLGLDQYVDTSRILDALMSNELDQRAVAEQIFRTALDNAGFWTTLPTGAAARATADDPHGNLTGNPIADNAIDDFIGRGATGVSGGRR